MPGSTHSEHLHEELLLLLLVLVLPLVVDLVAAAGQEAVVVLEQRGAPVLLLGEGHGATAHAGSGAALCILINNNKLFVFLQRFTWYSKTL